MDPTSVIDDALLSKLTRACVNADDLQTARTFAEAAIAPDFARCKRCKAPLLPGRTGRVHAKRKGLLAMTCSMCSEANAAVLKLEFEKRKKKKKAKASADAEETVSVPTVPVAKTPQQKALTGKTTAMTTLSKSATKAAALTPSAKRSLPAAATPHSFKQMKLDDNIKANSHKQSAPSVPDKPLTLLQLAEQRAKEEKKKKRLATKAEAGAVTTTTAAAPAKSSLTNIAKMLSN